MRQLDTFNSVSQVHKEIWTTMESKDRKEYNPFTLLEAEKQVPPRETQGGRGQQVRQQRRRGESDRRPRPCRPPNRTCSSTDDEKILCTLASGRTLAVVLSPPVSSLSVARKRHFVCRRLFASGQSMHQFRDLFLSCQPSRFVFVETQWTAKSDVLDIHH